MCVWDWWGAGPPHGAAGGAAVGCCCSCCVCCWCCCCVWCGCCIWYGCCCCCVALPGVAGRELLPLLQRAKIASSTGSCPPAGLWKLSSSKELPLLAAAGAATAGVGSRTPAGLWKLSSSEAPPLLVAAVVVGGAVAAAAVAGGSPGDVDGVRAADAAGVGSRPPAGRWKLSSNKGLPLLVATGAGALVADVDGAAVAAGCVASRTSVEPPTTPTSADMPPP